MDKTQHRLIPGRVRNWRDKTTRVASHEFNQIESELSDGARKHIAAKCLLCTNPYLSNGEIARLLNLSRAGVRVLRIQLEKEGRIERTDVRQNSQGEIIRGLKQDYAITLPDWQMAVADEVQNALMVIGQEPLPDDKNPAIMAINALERLNQNTDSLKGAMRKITANFAHGKDFETFNWFAFNTEAKASILLEVLKKSYKDTVVPGKWRGIKGVLKQVYKLEGITDREWEFIRDIKAPAANPTMPDIHDFNYKDWLNIHKNLDLSTNKGWMQMCAFMLMYPGGHRPSDMLGLRRKDLIGMERGYIMLIRGKNRLIGGMMVDHLSALRIALEKWATMIPSDSEYLWFHADPHSTDPIWSKPYKKSRGSSGWTSQLREEGKRHLGKRFIAKSGRQSYSTQCRLAGISTEDLERNGGWKQDRKASAHYVESEYPQMLGLFSRVEQFVEFNAEMEQIIIQHLQDPERAAIERGRPFKLCAEPDCDNVVTGKKIRCSGRCRQRARRRKLKEGQNA